MLSPLQILPTGFIGRSPSIVRIRAQIEKLGKNRAPVLLLGETGTGKEVAARSLYNADPCGRFVTVDCGAMVGPLLETELFGHARNAFTGAQQAKQGLIQFADGGTVFFDEIGELPLELQAKLLRVLQEKEFRPVGSLNRIAVDIRVIAATNRNLEREVAAGRFREDLYHRLNVIRITLPPLREHKEDLPLLIERFLAQDNQPRYSLTDEAMDALMGYDWPGNVRELKNCIDRMIALSSGPLLHVGDMPTNVCNHRAAKRGMANAVAASRQTTGPFSPAPAASLLTLEQVECEAILSALRYTSGDHTAAARMLGIGRTTIYRKIKQYRLAPRVSLAS